MMHNYCFAILAPCIVSISTINADVEIAPPPREIRPDGTRDPAPQSAVPKAQDPRETVERIIKNSKAVGDKLAMTDTGTETRKTQDTILKDIQSLIDQQENPPKSNQSQDMNKDRNPNDKDKNDKNDMGPMGDMNDTSNQKKDMQPNGGMDQSNMGGDSDQSKGRKPRQQGSDQPKERGGDPIIQNKKPNGKSETGKQQTTASQNPKQGKGRLPDPLSKGDSPPPLPFIPPEETVMKDVWGYLPDKLRQQAMQYYKQEFMPRYEKLLEHYYSSLADKKNKK
ncbi:MAG TPA: hypothetical protein VG097_12180 [Gemmata sp.]|jgi:hypothetical protein|nr:hypothetical protein [Gemmata sp.]